MKTIFIFLILFLLFPFGGISQINSDILLQDGTKWTEGFLEKSIYTFRSLTEYEVKGDTLIDKYIYKKVYSNREVVFYLREDETKNVYLCVSNPLTGNNTEVFLYSFDTWKVGKNISYVTFFGQKVTEVIEECNLDSIQLQDGKYYQRYKNIIRGIGNVEIGTVGILTGYPDDGLESCGAFLRIYNNGQLLYENKELINSLETRLVTEGVHWIERHSIENDPETPDPMSKTYELAHFRINGDTVINGKTYKKVYRNEEYYTGLREKDPVTIYRTAGEKEYLLYEFDWRGAFNYFDNDKGETFKFPYSPPEKSYLNGIAYLTSKVIYNPDLNAAPFRTHNKDVRLIINIGLTSGIFSHIQPARNCYCFNDLVCFYHGDKLIYQNPVFTETGEVLSIDTPQKEGNLSVLVSGNEVVFTLRNLSGRQYMVLNVYTAEGTQVASYSLQTGSVIVNDLPCGLYFYRLNKGKGMTETGKFCINNYH